jgi:hypothetical protein
MKKELAFIPIFFLVFAALATKCWAVVEYDSWVFRSEVVPGQSMWGPGRLPVLDFSDDYVFSSGFFRGTGFEWALNGSFGTVSGSVQGELHTNYLRRLDRPGRTTINLGYKGIEDGSKIGTDFGAQFVGTPKVKINTPWPFPDIDWKAPLNLINIGTHARVDFTTGLDQTAFGTDNQLLLAFGADVVLAGVYVNFYLDQDIYFTPKSIQGSLRYKHLESGIEMLEPVAFNSDTNLEIDVNLDRPGHWEVTLEDFSLRENTFRQEIDLSGDMGASIPLLGSDFALETESYFDLINTEFSLDFLNHGDDGDVATPDRIGRFNIYVNNVPLPGAAWLFAVALVQLVLFKRAGSVRLRKPCKPL